MIDCLIMGDSIAVGTHMFSKQCAVIAKNGINSYDWVNKNIDKSPYQAKTVIISLGSNDQKFIKTESELQTIRKLTNADRVYWILPAIKPNIQEIVKKVAAEHGDIVLPIRGLQPDGVHPNSSGYKDIVERTK
jgi:lysophospholipase L1-like esterase